MKFKLKYLLLLLVCISIIPLTTRADTKDTLNKTEVYNDVKDAFKTASPRIEKAVNSLATSLKVTANEVWGILVDQQRVYAVGYLILFILTIFCWLHFWYRWKQGVDNKWDNFNSGSYVLPALITFIISLIGTCVDGAHYMDMLTGLFNPRFGAMKDIFIVAQSLK